MKRSLSTLFVKISPIVFCMVFISLLHACTNRSKSLDIGNLRCELIANPLGIDIAVPRLSWELSSSEKSVLQSQYRILVSSSMEKLNKNEGDLWDSGEVLSDASAFVSYEGKALESRMECYWKVHVTTNKGNSTWSLPAAWTMGLLTPEEWQAKWIGLNKSFEWDAPNGQNTRLSARYLRKEFDVEQKPMKATLYLCGLGLYKLHINGKVIGDQELAPNLTDYRKEAKYNTFDITDAIQEGSNAVGVVLGNGRFFHMRHTEPYDYAKLFLPQYPKLILQMEIEYANGEKRIITSDESWKITADGPIRANNEYDGEEYDARKEMPGWDNPGFDDKSWTVAELIPQPQNGLNAQLNSHIKIMDVLQPIGIKKIKEGTYILDMGQNMVGWLKMKVKGNNSDQVCLRFAEFLNEDGTINQDNLRGGLAVDKYTLKGGGEEIWEPSFTYHGFRFVEITGYPGVPAKENFEGRILHDEMEQTGTFETSNALVNQIYKNAYWSIRGNYRSIPTDCPQRTERMGWTGDRAIGSYGESFIFDNNNLYAKWIDDICMTQREDGSVSDIAPSYWSSYSDNMTWPGTYLTVSNMLYEQYGNARPIIKHYYSMKKWLYYMRDKYLAPDHIMRRDVYGDWCTPPEDITFNDPVEPTLITDKAVIGTSYYYYMLRLLEKFAGIVGKPDEAKEFADQAIVVKDAYNTHFFDKDKGYYSNNTVTANLLSLSFDLVPDEYRKKVSDNMVNRTNGEFEGHISTGIIGCQWIMRGFTNEGRPDVAYQLLQKTDYPSFGYMIEKGATTIWEHWNGDGLPKWIDSQNHVMLLGDLIIWFYEDVAGIKNTPGSTGFKKITMKPQLIEGLDRAKASYHSVHGTIKSAWVKDSSSFKWDITIPCNTTAMVYFPVVSETAVREGGQKPSPENVKFVKMDGSYAVFEVGSGSYAFSGTLN